MKKSISLRSLILYYIQRIYTKIAYTIGTRGFTLSIIICDLCLRIANFAFFDTVHDRHTKLLRISHNFSVENDNDPRLYI